MILKLIPIIAVIFIAVKYLLPSGSLIGGILGIAGGPVLLLLLIIYLLKRKKGKTGIDEIDRYL